MKLKPIPDDPDHMRELFNQFFYSTIPTKDIEGGYELSTSSFTPDDEVSNDKDALKLSEEKKNEI